MKPAEPDKILVLEDKPVEVCPKCKGSGVLEEEDKPPVLCPVCATPDKLISTPA